MMPEFVARALMAGFGLTLATGPLGAFVVWRRMAYFGDAVSHAAILGVALSVALSLPLYVGTLAVALACGLTLAALAGRGHQADTALGVIAHSALALGLVAVSFLPSVRADLNLFLFGDILTVGWRDVAMIWLGAAAVVALIALRWSGLLTATLNEELAQASGVDPRRERLVLTLATAVTVALSIRIVGALLIAALLIIPPAAARSLSRTPEAMALWAAAIGAGSVAAGLWASLMLDTPAGPSIIVAALVAFLASLMVRGPAR